MKAILKPLRIATAALFAGMAAVAACGRPVAPSLSVGTAASAQRLSETGLYSDIAQRTIAADNRLFRPTYELWSDGSVKRRWMFLPSSSTGAPRQIDTSDPNHWNFPAGTLVWKEFAFLGRPVETRLLEKYDETPGLASWGISTFLWREDGTDADRINHGRPDVAPTGLGPSHDIPSVADGDCLKCHDAGGDVLLGVSALQLAGPGEGLRLADLASEGRLSTSVPAPLIPGDPAAQQVYGELHANCGHCHAPYEREFPGRGEETGIYLHLPAEPGGEHDLPVWQSAVGRVIVPGAPEASPLSSRAWLRGEDDGGNGQPIRQMPPLATEVVDEAMLGRWDAWIRTLTTP